MDRKNWTLHVAHKLPSINSDKVPCTGTYVEATEAAIAKYVELGRSVWVTREDDYYFWFHVSSNGAVCRNKNSGVPEFQEVSR